MTDREPDEADTPPRLSLVEAAARTGRKPEAIRAMVHRGRLKAVRGNDGRLLVELPADPAVAGRPAGQEPDEAGQVAALEAELAGLREALSRALLAAGRAEAERDAAKATAAAEVAALRELVAELKAMLAEARRPWWRRVFGGPS